MAHEALFDLPDDGPYMPRAEWADLNVYPLHPECPMVQSIDAAQNTVEKSHQAGLINGEVAEEKIGALQLRRIAIAEAQSTFGCPRKSMDEEARLAEEKAFNCGLPTGRVE